MKRFLLMICCLALVPAFQLSSCTNAEEGGGTNQSVAEGGSEGSGEVTDGSGQGDNSSSGGDTPVDGSPDPVDNGQDGNATVQAETLKVVAKFVDFELGDASHFIFEDESGKTWDFGGCNAENCDFAQELSEEEANMDNQGWGANPDAVGQWYELGYVEEERPLYIDGPVGTVQVIALVIPAM